MTGGLPYKSYMPLDLFRVGDRVTPTRGLLRGTPGVVVALRSEKYGREMVVIRFDRLVKKYDAQEEKYEWAFDPENVRLEAFPIVSRI